MRAKSPMLRRVPMPAMLKPPTVGESIPSIDASKSQQEICGALHLVVSYNYMTQPRKTENNVPRGHPIDRARGASPASLPADAGAVFDVMTELLRLSHFPHRDPVGPHWLTTTQPSPPHPI